MKATKKTLRFTLTTPLVGSLPNKDLLVEHIANNAPTDAAKDQEAAAVPSLEEQLERGTNVFARNMEDKKQLHLWDYHVKGMIKELIGIHVEAGDLAPLTKWTFKRFVDDQIFTYPRRIHLRNKAGEEIFTPDGSAEYGQCPTPGINVRPLRATTMQGDRVAIARSEMVADGTYFDCEVELIESSNAKSKSHGFDYDSLLEVLAYGQRKGMGQWRNAGWGRFTVVELPAS